MTKPASSRTGFILRDTACRTSRGFAAARPMLPLRPGTRQVAPVDAPVDAPVVALAYVPVVDVVVAAGRAAAEDAVRINAERLAGMFVAPVTLP